MDALILHSKRELSSLWNIVKDRFPSQAIWMQKNRDGNYTLAISKHYFEQFKRIFARWFHQKICDTEIEKVLSNYHYLSQMEKEEIISIAKNEVEEAQEEFIFFIEYKLNNLVENSAKINLEGFIVFGMQEYRKKLEDIVEECLEIYFCEQDYQEFLDLLRYFIAIEEYRFGHLTVVAQPNGSYRYYDEDYHDITLQCMEQFLGEYHDEEAEPNDSFITILILMLPEKISIYGIENIANYKFINTLHSVFESRIKFHHGCNIIPNNKM